MAVNMAPHQIFFRSHRSAIQTNVKSISIILSLWNVVAHWLSFHLEGRGFDSRSSRQVGTLGKSLTHSCLWRFGVKLRHSIRAVSGALLSSSYLKRRYRNSLNE